MFSKEIVFASANPNESAHIALEESKGRLKRIAPRLYATNLLDSPENIVRRNLHAILAWRFPGCLISHKSAFTLKPTEKGNFYITYSFNRRIEDLPGITINVISGPKPLETDSRLGQDNIYVSSMERRYLEVLQVSRKGKDGESKGLPLDFIETKIEAMIRDGGEMTVNSFRDKAKQISQRLGADQEFTKLNNMISALMSTHEEKILSTIQGKARAAGEPMDARRIALFESLYEELNSNFYPIIPDSNKSEDSFRMFSFFESYFSNYIEGTKFEIGEAKQIIDTGITIPKRIKDSHDIIGTFRLLSNRQEMSTVPSDENEFIQLLKRRHSVLLAGRPEYEPGVFKTINNRAGNTSFVSPELVSGTLKHGFKFYRGLNSAFAKAVFMMFLCSEVHPFNDGNGRISRIMMNAELFSKGQTRIIIPTVFRDDYVTALKRLSNNGDPKPFINVLLQMQEFSASLWGENFNKLNEYLLACRAYEEPNEGKLIILDRLGYEKIVKTAEDLPLLQRDIMEYNFIYPQNERIIRSIDDSGHFAEVYYPDTERTKQFEATENGFIIRDFTTGVSATYNRRTKTLYKNQNQQEIGIIPDFH